MFEPKAQQCEFASIAGKVFLLGEYAVLMGLPAVVAAVGPRFTLKGSVDQATLKGTPGSPLDRLIQFETKENRRDPILMEVVDPHHQRGGFGASTAEFALAYMAYRNQGTPEVQGSGKTHWKKVWALYRSLMTDPHSQSVAPSGADLVAQWQGGVLFFDPTGPHCMDLWPLMDWSGLLIFSATGIPGRKMATHRHLEDLRLDSRAHDLLEVPLRDGVSAIEAGSFPKLGQAMTAYAEALASLGLETQAAKADREILSKLPGVLGVKGAGAGLSDSVLVALQNHSARDQVIERAKSLGLVLVADGLQCEMGIACRK